MLLDYSPIYFLRPLDEASFQFVEDEQEHRELKRRVEGRWVVVSKVVITVCFYYVGGKIKTLVKQWEVTLPPSLPVSGHVCWNRLARHLVSTVPEEEGWAVRKAASENKPWCFCAPIEICYFFFEYDVRKSLIIICITLISLRVVLNKSMYL